MKPTRLKGKKLIALYRQVYERDNGCCVRCGRWIEEGTIPHHRKYKSQGGGDTLDNLEMLCMECHSKEHTGRRLSCVNSFRGKSTKETYIS